jgi:pimeloyl-ACP methyl ester carboxylesterase
LADRLPPRAAALCPPVATPHDRYVLMRDGALVYYRAEGRGPVVVLCDGIGCEGVAWRYLSPALARDHLVIHVHNRGHGRSPAPPDPERVSIEDLADDAVAILDDLAVGPAIFAGHSMGVQTALEAYRRHRQRVRGLVLLCGSYGAPLRTFYGSDVLHHLLPVLRRAVARTRGPFGLIWRSLIPTDLAHRLALRVEINGRLVQRQDVDDYLEHLSRVEPSLFFRMLSCAERHSAGDLLEQIDVPVLLVDGERDGFTPLELSREMARRISGARLVVVPGGTHAAPIERPELVTAAVEEFVRDVDRRSERPA